MPGFELQERVHATDRSTLDRAVRTSDGMAVLIKASGPGIAPREAFVRYRRERELLDSLAGVGVVRALDVILAADFAAIVLEDPGGRPLKELVRDGAVPIAEALEITRKLANALDGIHAAGIIHRGLNAWNVVHAPARREVTIIDLELATNWRMEGVSAAVAGRLPYLAPEQVGRVNRRVESLADLYALGVIACELMTGRLPADADDARSLVGHHLGGAPTVIVDIVCRLLAAAPERRYQTAVAVAADLAECEERLAMGSRESFPIARNDVSSRFDFPEKVYGREVEIGKLFKAFERAADGVAGVVLVSGSSGIGKTSVVRELRVPALERGGFFATARLDPLLGERAHTALASALDDVVREVAGASDEVVASWRRRILEAVGENGRVVVEALPSIERIIGPQPALVALDPDASLARFGLTLQRLIRVFAQREHPLVLFVDDLQWANTQTLDLLRLLAMAESPGALLIVGAYRDDQVGGIYQLLATVGELTRRDGLVERIEVPALAGPAVVELLADMLHREREDVAELADIILRKTGGSPFFIRQLLASLHAAQQIRLDGPSRQFVFDLASIHDAGITDNVAGVLTENFERLPITTQRVLSLAAAVGIRFDLEILAVVADMPLERVHDELVVAIANDMVLPLSDLEYFDDAEGRPWLMCRWFGFQHDRIHEAAHAQLSRSERERLHVAIGRLLLQRALPAELDEHMYEIIQHLNRGLPLIGERAERAGIADLALRAGRRAHDAGAHEVAVASFRCAVKLRAWTEDYDVALQAHQALAESLRLTLDLGGALAVLKTATAHARAARDVVAIAALAVKLHAHRGEIREAIACCRRAARVAGVELPVSDPELSHAIDATMAEVLGAIDRRPIAALVDLPVMTDPDTLALMTLLVNTVAGAYQIEPKLFTLLVATMVSLSVRHGNSAESARAYATFAIICHRLGREDDRTLFGKLGFELAARFDDRAAQASVGYLYASLSAPWIAPIDHCLEALRVARSDGLTAGLYSHMGFSAALIGILKLWKGVPLAELADECGRDHKLILEMGEPGFAAIVAATSRLIHAYRTELPGEAALPDDRVVFDDDNLPQRVHVGFADVERHYMLGDAARALAIADALPGVMEVLLGSFTAVIFRFFHCLAVTAVWSEEGRDARERMLAQGQAEMKRWADRCPANFSAMYLLVEAERARVGGLVSAALDLYDEAIAAATEHGLLKLAALGNELAARFWRDRRKPDLARVYAIKAAQLYGKWGARRKVQLLALAEA